MLEIVAVEVADTFFHSFERKVVVVALSKTLLSTLANLEVPCPLPQDFVKPPAVVYLSKRSLIFKGSATTLAVAVFKS